jgi:hypothetical protein
VAIDPGFRLWIEHGQSRRLCDLSLNRRIRRLHPCCRPKLQRARFMDFRRLRPYSDRPLERFPWHLKIERVGVEIGAEGERKVGVLTE